VLALHLTQQNAGLILRKQARTFSIETFELSATSKIVTNTIGRVVRRFPGPIIAVSDARVLTPDFRKSFTQCLVALEGEKLNNTVSNGHKSNKETANPQFATEWLPGILRGIGSPLNIPRIYKRTRDEVLCSDGMEPVIRSPPCSSRASINPLKWRRSPRWMLLRVALQTSIAGPGGDHTRYKMFMIYFMATLLDEAVKNKCPSDMLHVMLAKINQRILKVDPSVLEAPWAQQAQEFVDETMESARDIITERWSAIQKSADSASKFRLADLKKLKPHKNTILGLPKLRPYIEGLHNMQLPSRSAKTFDEKCGQRINARESILPNPSSLDLTLPLELGLCLMDVELWVVLSLDPWIERHHTSKNSLTKLSKMIDWYINKAVPVYNESPEGFSVMILTLMILWTALDKATVTHYPLLGQFDPGIPPDIFDPLLLPKREQMRNLRDVEKYLLKRKSKSLLRNPSVFGNISSPFSFGAQYFDQCPELQQLKRQIEADAELADLEKKAELAERKREFRKLMKQSETLSCSEIMKMTGRGRNRREEPAHDPKCKKCQLRKEAQTLDICCHEWPLPATEPAAKFVVFELDVPILIRGWRSATYRILVDVLNPFATPRGKPKNITLNEYEGLANYMKLRPDRLELASSTQPYVSMTRHNHQPIAEATEATVCLPSNLNFYMQDSRSQRGATEQLKKYDIHERCTLKLPKGCYETLQYAVKDTKHTPNEVLSRQVNCPAGLTVHEFQAFAGLRSGNRLQVLFFLLLSCPCACQKRPKMSTTIWLTSLVVVEYRS
jgi:hypothetical protein